VSLSSLRRGSCPAAVGLLLLGLLFVLACVAPQASSAGSLRSGNWEPPHYLERQLSHCGVVTVGGFSARVTAFKVPCGKARRIVESYMRQGRPPAPVKIKGFPAWKCSSGSGLGTCRWHDKLGSRAPEIVFAWVP
jgi:hypothetical protein